MRCFTYINGAPVEVFDPPFFQQTRDLANRCFDDGPTLDWDTPSGDDHAARRLRVAIDRELRGATGAWAEELEAIRRSITRDEYGPLALLYSLTWDGGGRRPPGALYDWFEPATDNNQARAADSVAAE